MALGSGWNQYLRATSQSADRAEGVGYGTENGAVAFRVTPPSVHVTVCVPVPGFVCVVVPYVHETAPLPRAMTVGVRPPALLMFPDGSLAWALQLAPASVVAETSPYRDALIDTDNAAGDGVAGEGLVAIVGAAAGTNVG